MEKATFRLPEWQMDRVREESERQQRSINSIVIDVIARGLGQTPDGDDLLRVLGPMVVRPPLTTAEQEPDGTAPRPPLGDALDWARGDR